MTTQPSAAARIAKLWLDVLFVLGALVCGAFLIWLVAAPIAMAVSDVPADVSVRVAIGDRALRSVVSVAGRGMGSVAIDSLRVVGGTGELRFVTTQWWLHVASAGHMLIGALLVLWVVYLLRRILASAVAERPFAPANVRRIRLLGLLLLGISVLRPLVEYVTARLVLSRIAIESLALRPPVGFGVEAALGGVLLLALAGIFSHGARLELEKSLTI